MSETATRTPRGASKRRQAADGGGPTGERIWLAAAQLFREVGYSAATTRQLSERLGIQKATLYYYVSKKEDLLHAICVEALTRVTVTVQAAIDGETDPLERVRALIAAHLVSMLSDDLDMHATMLLELNALQGEQRAEVVVLRDRYERIVIDTIDAAQQAGALRGDFDAKQLSVGLLNLMNWTITWFQPQGSLKPIDIAAFTCELFLNGAKAPSSKRARVSRK